MSSDRSSVSARVLFDRSRYVLSRKNQKQECKDSGGQTFWRHDFTRPWWSDYTPSDANQSHGQHNQESSRWRSSARDSRPGADSSRCPELYFGLVVEPPEFDYPFRITKHLEL